MDILFKLIQVGAGILLLLAGKRLITLAIGVAGFTAGLILSSLFFQDAVAWQILLAGVAGALLAVLLVLLLKNITFGLGGFLLGAYLVDGLLKMAQVDLGIFRWALLVLGGVLAAWLLLSAFDLAIRAVTAAAGAMLVTQVLPDTFAFRWVVFAILVVVGIIVQSGRRKKAPLEEIPPKIG